MFERAIEALNENIKEIESSVPKGDRISDEQRQAVFILRDFKDLLRKTSLENLKRGGIRGVFIKDTGSGGRRIVWPGSD